MRKSVIYAQCVYTPYTDKENDDEWIELGLNETQEGLLIVEWPEKAEKFIRQSALVLNFNISQKA